MKKGRYMVAEYNEKHLNKVTYWKDLAEAKYYAHDSHYALVVDTVADQIVAAYGEIENRVLLQVDSAA